MILPSKKPNSPGLKTNWKSARPPSHYDNDPSLLIRKNIDIRDPIDAVSCNRAQDQIVCAGSRGVLQIFKVAKDGLTNWVDLRKDVNKGKNKTPLLYSPTNVAWSKLADEYIATTSTMGAVVLWNVAALKIEGSWKAHNRSATVVRFHRSDRNLMASGSRDHFIYIYDIRNPEPCTTISKGVTDTIWDLTWSRVQGDDHYLLTGDEGGVIKIYDHRMPTKALNARTLHNGRISSIQSHPTRPWEVATGGGRDKKVQIYNWKKNVRLKHVQTYAPVGRVHWRPDNPNQFTTCAVVSDMSTLMWDIRRPHLPMVAFPGHKDSVTDVFWSCYNPQSFVSVGKDGMVMLHHVKEGDYTVDHLCDSHIDIAPDGLLVIGSNAENKLKKQPKWETKHQMQLGKTRTISEKRKAACARVMEQRRKSGGIPPYEPFSHNVKSNISMGIPSLAKHSLTNRLFEIYAKHYIVGEKPIADICEHNAVVSAHQGDEVREQLWRYVGGLLADAGYQEKYDAMEREEERRERENLIKNIKEYESYCAVLGIHFPDYPDVPEQFFGMHKKPVKDPSKLVDEDVLKWMAEMEFKAEYVERDPDALKTDSPPGDEFCGLPAEAFGIKRYFQDPSSTELTEDKSWRNDESREGYTPENVLVQTLHFLAHQGDVQMCATICTVAGKLLTKVLSEYYIEAWVQSYMNMLYRLSLHETVAALRKFTCVRRIQEEGSDETCGRYAIWHYRRNPAWGFPAEMRENKSPEPYILCKGKIRNGNCDKCHTPILAICGLCDKTISGLIWNCNKCGHSMHLDHFYVWFRRRFELKDPCGQEFADETIEERRARLMASKHTKMIDRTIKYCPVAECRCECLNKKFDKKKIDTPSFHRERLDELAAKMKAGVINKKDLRSQHSRQVEEDRIRRRTEAEKERQKFIAEKKRIMDDMKIRGRRVVLEELEEKKMADEIEKRENIEKWKNQVYNRWTATFFEPEYDCRLRNERLLNKLVKAAKTEDQLKLCYILKMISALPVHYQKFLKNEFTKTLPKKEESKELIKKEEHVPAVVRFGLTTMKSIQERQAKKNRKNKAPQLSAEKKAEKRQKSIEEGLKNAQANWGMEILKPCQREPKKKPVGSRELGQPRTVGTGIDILRIVFQELARKLYWIEKARVDENHLERTTDKILYYLIMDIFQEERPKDKLSARRCLSIFLGEILRKRRKKDNPIGPIVDNLKRMSRHSSTMIDFLAFRKEARFKHKDGRVYVVCTSGRARRPRMRHRHLRRVIQIRKFKLMKSWWRRSREKLPGRWEVGQGLKWDTRGAEPPLPPFPDEVRARQISTPRSSGRSVGSFRIRVGPPPPEPKPKPKSNIPSALIPPKPLKQRFAKNGVRKQSKVAKQT